MADLSSRDFAPPAVGEFFSFMRRGLGIGQGDDWGHSCKPATLCFLPSAGTRFSGDPVEPQYSCQQGSWAQVERQSSSPLPWLIGFRTQA